MDDTVMTAAELQTLRAELGELEGDGRRAIAARIKTAREWGDLKENGEYHAAKESQAHLETRILKLREQLRTALVVETTASEAVQHGSTVSVTDVDTDRVQQFKIVSPHEAKPATGLLSASSPVARALIGRRVSEVVKIETPAGVRKLRIDSIS